MIPRRTSLGPRLLAAPGIVRRNKALVFPHSQGILHIDSLSEGPVGSFPSCVVGITARWIPAPIATDLLKPMK